MTAYTVAAENRFFFQRLVVDAPTKQDAEAAFREWLASDEALQTEEYEYEQQPDDDEVKASGREDYRYRFQSVDVEEFDGDPLWNGEPSSVVQMIDAGGTG